MMKLYRMAGVGTLLAAALMAQGPFGGGGPRTPPDPATMVAERVARLTKVLTLTPSQVTQATTIFTNAANAITPLQTTASTDRTSLQAAIKSNATSTIDQLSASLGTINGQITAIQSKADAAFYAILDATQQTTLNSHHGGHGGPGGGFGPGNRGH